MDIDSAVAEYKTKLEKLKKSGTTGTYIMRIKINCGGIRCQSLYGSGLQRKGTALLVTKGDFLDLEEI